MIPLKKCCAVANGLSHVLLLFMAAAARLPTFHVSETTAVAAASRIRCSRRRDSRQTQCETWEKCAEFAVVPPPPAAPVGRSAGRTSFASLGVVSDRFSSLTRRRPRRFHRRRRRCQSRLGIRQAGAASVRCSLPVSRMGEKGPEWE